MHTHTDIYFYAPAYPHTSSLPQQILSNHARTLLKMKHTQHTHTHAHTHTRTYKHTLLRTHMYSHIHTRPHCLCRTCLSTVIDSGKSNSHRSCPQNALHAIDWEAAEREWDWGKSVNSAAIPLHAGGRKCVSAKYSSGPLQRQLQEVGGAACVLLVFWSN
jgi:hypothetical protein